MDNRRLLLAAVLSVGVLILWQVLFPAPPPERPVRPPLPPPVGAAGENEPSLGVGAAAEGERPAVPERADPSVGEPIEAQLVETFVLESGRYRAELSNRGAQLVSLVLKEHSRREGGQVDLIRARGTDPYPFALTLDGSRSHPLNQALFVAEREGSELRFRHRSAAGTASKRFRVLENGLLEVAMTVSGGGWGAVVGPGVRNPTGTEAEGRFYLPMASYALRGDGGSETLDARKQSEDVVVPAAGLRWVALEDTYFLTAIVPREGLAAAVVRQVFERPEVASGEPRFLGREAGEGNEALQPQQLLILEAAGNNLELQAFFGAKRYSELAALPHALEETVRFGFFGFLARPLYYGLEWIHARVVANYGWAIVLMTLLIKVVFFPLTHKSQVSMGKMQELNPKVQAIRAKHRGRLKDKQGRPNMDVQRQMNEEVMAVYRSAGVNPVSGCFPMLLQIPVFFAFFRLLSVSIELRNAPWLLWIQDLSAPDPYFVLPLVMGGTSVLLQRMTPSAPDPMQRRMMQLMPVMFTVFALYFQSGLVLYWLTNNLLTMAQQGAYLRYRRKKREGEAGEAGKKPSSKAQGDKARAGARGS